MRKRSINLRRLELPAMAAGLALVLGCTVLGCPHAYHVRAEWSHLGHDHASHGTGHRGDSPQPVERCPDSHVPHHDHDRCDFDAGHEHTFLSPASNPLQRSNAAVAGVVLIDSRQPASARLRIEDGHVSNAPLVHARTVRLLL